jgi:hypothetical protein
MWRLHCINHIDVIIFYECLKLKLKYLEHTSFSHYTRVIRDFQYKN